MSRDVKVWANMERTEVKKFVRNDGALDEFALMSSKKKELPLHYMLFRSHAAHLGHEANTESLFSRAGTRMYMCTNVHTHTHDLFLTCCRDCPLAYSRELYR